MNKFIAGVIAAFCATVVLSVLMMIKAQAGLLPQMNVIHMLSAMAHQRLATPLTPVMGWAAHFVIGSVVWGVLFALIRPILPGAENITKGLMFSLIAWLIMMVVLMPMVGAGLFGLAMGVLAPVMTLVLHLIFGAVLGGVYNKLAY